MVNEVVMYQSMFVLGVVMFGFFAASFGNYSDFAESITLDNNLDRVLEEINEELLQVLDRASELRGKTGTILINIKLDLDAEYANEAYTIQPSLANAPNVTLQAIVKGDVLSELSISTEAGTDFNLRQVQFSGSISSSSDDTGFIYQWDGIVESITFY